MPLQAGDLLLMSGTCQQFLQHRTSLWKTLHADFEAAARDIRTDMVDEFRGIVDQLAQKQEPGSRGVLTWRRIANHHIGVGLRRSHATTSSILDDFGRRRQIGCQEDSIMIRTFLQLSGGTSVGPLCSLRSRCGVSFAKIGPAPTL